MKKILIVGPSWVGDMVMAQALFRLLVRDPDIELHVLAPTWSLGLLQRMPEISQAHSLDIGHGELALKKRWQIAQALKKEGFNQAILLPNSLKSALIPFLAGIHVRTGWRGEWRYGLLNDLRILDKQRLKLMVERFVALGPRGEQALHNYPLPKLKAKPSTALLERFQLSTQRPILALCPGAEFGPAKRWPEQHYASLAASKINQGWQVWIMGSQADAALAEDIRQRLSAEQALQCSVLAGRTQLAEAVDLMALAKAVVTNDSGLMHVSAALSVPTIALFGSSSPEFTPPLSNKISIVRQTIDCSPCFKRTCPLQHLDCLNTLLPSKVESELDELLNRWQITVS